MFFRRGSNCIYSGASHQLYVFPARKQLYIFRRFATVICFSGEEAIVYIPALRTSYMFFRRGSNCIFSCASHQLHAFPCFESVVCFPALGTSCMFSRAKGQWYIFPRLALIVYMFFLACNRLHTPFRRYGSHIDLSPGHPIMIIKINIFLSAQLIFNVHYGLPWG